MYRKKHLWILLLCMAAGCTQDPYFAPEERVEEPVNEQEYKRGFLRVLVSEGLSGDMEAVAASGRTTLDALPAKEVVTKLSVRSMKRTFPPAGRFEARTRKAKLHLWYDVEFDETISIVRAGNDLSGIPGIRQVEYRPVAVRYWDDRVEYVEVAATAAAAAVPNATLPFNDPQLPKQWHYYNDGSLGAQYTPGADINVLGAWNNYTTGSADVVVAVIDGGIDYTHEDLAANMWVNTTEKNGTGSVDDDRNGYKDDIYGYNFVADVGQLVPHDHGTHVAGTIAAVNNNGKGVSGIAGGNGATGSGVRLMSCQIFVPSDDPYSENGGSKGATAIKYAADNGAVICQNSWGYPSLTTIPGSDKAAIDYFIEYAGIDESGQQTGAMRGGLVIFAAGNEQRQAAAPANYEKVVAVTAIAPNYRKAYYSNYGDWTDVAAPGGDQSTHGSQGTILSTVVGGYGYMQGTSMACPHVSGVAALVLSQYKSTGYNPEMLRGRLEQNATDIDSYNASYRGKLGKLVNATASLAGGSTIPPENVGQPEGSAVSNTVRLNWVVPSDPDDGKAVGFNVYFRKTSLSGLNLDNLPADVMINSFSTGDVNAGDRLYVEIDGLDFETTYYFAVRAFDFSGNFSALSPQVAVTTLSNTPPVITVTDSTDVLMKAYETVNLRFTGVDPDGHDLIWSLQPPAGEVSLVELGDGKIQVTITGRQATAGAHSLSLVLQDEYGASDTQTIRYEVVPNHPPVATGALTDVYIGALNAEKTFTLSDYFLDEDGETLKYTITNDVPGVVNVNANRGILYVTSLSYGLTRSRVTATDGLGEEVSQSFTILVRDDTQEIDLYPNPVVNNLYLRTGREMHCTVMLYSSAGTRVLEREADISPFLPAAIDLSSLHGGAYSVVVKYAGGEIKKNIIKL
jgi:subtilisin family serine protease